MTTGEPIGVELVGGSTTSLGIPEALNVPAAVLEGLAAANDPHVKFYDFERRGYGLVTVTKNELTCEFKAVDALTKGAKPESLATFKVESGVPAVNQV
jgi:phosphodiesterase/alkaline phosphatase D-like protein